MIFNSWIFVAFFAVVMLVHWKLPTLRGRHLWLLGASYVFYGWWDWRFLALIFTVSLVAYGAAMTFARYPCYKKRIATVAIVALLSVLAVFKYYGFFVSGLMPLLTAVGLHDDLILVDIILPVGISFYIFQSISYVMDVYWGKITADRSFARVALYIAFFPQLVAGPIVRAEQFFPQLARKRHFSKRAFYWGGRLIIVGLVYKIVLADNLASCVDPVLDDLQGYDRISLIGALVAFHGQIYFDFAGYSTIAIGVALLLGYHLPRNFNFPYISASPTEFWRRWHISLSQWFRDYLFIPLGGGRVPLSKYIRNLILTMGLAGLWHGAALGFVLWGLGHGLMLTAHKLLIVFGGARCFPRIFTVVLTQVCVLLLWSGFRLSDVGDLMRYWSIVLGNTEAGKQTHLGSAAMLLVLFLPVVVDHALGALHGVKIKNKYSSVLFWGMCGGIAALIALAYPIQSPNFVYFQF